MKISLGAAALLCLSCVLIAAQSEVTAQNSASSSGTPVYLADGTRLKNLHEVVGIIPVTERQPPTITLSGAATFSSANSYFCTAPNANLDQGFLSISNVDGARFIIRNFSGKPVPAVYRCIGN